MVEKALSIEGGGTPTAGGGAAADDGDIAPFIAAFDDFSAPSLAKFTAACDAIGGEDAAALKELWTSGWAAQRQFLVVASKCKKPADKMGVLKATGCVDAVQSASKAVKRGDWEFHYKAVSEAMNCLNWLMIDGNPREVIDAQLEASDYNQNKIRIKFKRNTDNFDQNQHDFCDALKQLLKDLSPYTKTHHVAGVTWNFKGGDALAFAGSAPAAAPAPAAMQQKAAPAAAAGGGGGGGNGPAVDLKAALGSMSTATLKKVTKEQQTWRKEFKGGEAPVVASKAPAARAAARPAANKLKGDKGVNFKNQGHRWCVEAMSKDDGVVTVEVDNVRHSVAIYGCYQATIDIKGKVKTVSIDSCEQVKVLMDTTISAVEVLNCKRMQVQIRDKSPVVNIDKTDGCLTYLSAEGLDTSFCCAKSSEMNVCFPDPNSADGDLKEVPIPEQFVHKVVLGDGPPKMSAEISELYS